MTKEELLSLLKSKAPLVEWRVEDYDSDPKRLWIAKFGNLRFGLELKGWDPYREVDAETIIDFMRDRVRFLDDVKRLQIIAEWALSDEHKAWLAFDPH